MAIFLSRVALASGLLLVLSTGYGQDKVDSLKALLWGASKPDRVDILIDLCRETIDLDHQQALSFAREGLKIAFDIKDSIRMVKAARIKAISYRRLEYMDSSTNLSIEVLPVARKYGPSFELRRLLTGIAVGYTWYGQYDLALYYNFEAITLAKEARDSSMFSTVSCNIGLIYYKLCNFDKALEYLIPALGFCKNKSADVQSYLNIALCYANKAKFDIATSYLDSAFVFQASPQNYLECTIDKAMIYKMQFLKDSAIFYFKKSLQLANTLNRKRDQSVILIELASLASQGNHIAECRKYLSLGESILQSTSFNFEMLLIYKRLGDLFKEIKDLDRFYAYQEKYIHLKDSIYSRTYLNNLVTVENDFLEKRMNVEIGKQQASLVQKDGIIYLQRITTILVGLLAMSLAILVYVLFKNYRQKKHANLLLDQKVDQRTRELERQHLLLQQRFAEFEERMTKNIRDVRSSAATVKGLFAITDCEGGLKRQVNLLIDDVEQFTSNLQPAPNQVSSPTNRTTK
jgi:tetratricopeptide (TPR) repeat protein